MLLEGADSEDQMTGKKFISPVLLLMLSIPVGERIFFTSTDDQLLPWCVQPGRVQTAAVPGEGTQPAGQQG